MAMMVTEITHDLWYQAKQYQIMLQGKSQLRKPPYYQSCLCGWLRTWDSLFFLSNSLHLLYYYFTPQSLFQQSGLFTLENRHAIYLFKYTRQLGTNSDLSLPVFEVIQVRLIEGELKIILFILRLLEIKHLEELQPDLKQSLLFFFVFNTSALVFVHIFLPISPEKCRQKMGSMGSINSFVLSNSILWTNEMSRF